MPRQRLMGTVWAVRRLLDECERAARAEGWRGAWEPTEADLDYITADLGVRPTRQQWADAGLPHIGGKHCADH